jgi:hypothetical protein
MTTQTIASLVLDDTTIYPRHSVSSSNISGMKEAIRAGTEMPPITIDDKTNKVIDGVHRVHAYEQLFGPEHEIAVIRKHYRNRAAMLADAIALNVGRGQDLTRWDLMRCVGLAEEVGMSIDTLAKLVKWQPERLSAYRDSRMGATLDDRRLALKRSIRHRLQQPLNKAQEQANEHLSGMSPLFHVNQLVMLIDTDLLPEDNDELRKNLQHLADLINSWMLAKGA